MTPSRYAILRVAAFICSEPWNLLARYSRLRTNKKLSYVPLFGRNGLALSDIIFHGNADKSLFTARDILP